MANGHEFLITENDWITLKCDVREIKNAMIGTMTERGYINKCETRFRDLFAFKQLLCTVFVWSIRTVTASVVVAMIGGTIKCMLDRGN